jgi:hypothetical protein
MRRRRQRSWKRTGFFLLAIAALLLGGSKWLLRSAYAVEHVVAQIGSALGVPVRIAGIDLGFTGSSLSNLEVLERDSSPGSPPWLTIGSLDADLTLPQLIRGNLSDGLVTLRDVHVILRFDRDGRLLTRLPAPSPKEPGAMPRVRLVEGTFTLCYEGRPDETFHNIAFELRHDGPMVLVSGAIDDPDWGPWTITASQPSPASPFALNLKTRKIVHVTPELLRRTPFVPANVWEQVTCEGDTPCEVALLFNPVSPVNYRVSLEPRNTKVFVRSIELRAEAAEGSLVIADNILTLENVRGKSANGELKLRSIMDFTGLASIMKFSLEASLLNLTQLPFRWGVPALRGDLNGKAELVVTSAVEGTTVKGQGEGSVKLPLLLRPIKVKLIADGRRIGFQIARE